jgi:ubiquinone/menaquinone biosynthesis C-methylase UbiE
MAAGAGEHIHYVAKKVGPSGSVLTTGISSHLLAFAGQRADFFHTGSSG